MLNKFRFYIFLIRLQQTVASVELLASTAIPRQHVYNDIPVFEMSVTKIYFVNILTARYNYPLDNVAIATIIDRH